MMKRTRPRSCGREGNLLREEQTNHDTDERARNPRGGAHPVRQGRRSLPRGTSRRPSGAYPRRAPGTREDLDAFATESHGRASAAAREGKNKEILPTPGLDPDGNEVELTTDEGIRHNIDAGKMANLKTVFRPEGEGVVTAGNSSQLTDGASALLVGDREVAESDEAGTTSLSQKPTWTRRMWHRYCTRQGRPPLPKALC
jgi:Thiolase, N-terminal domain